MSRRTKKILRRHVLATLRRLGAGFVAVAVIVGQVPAFGAFEAHVVNVTARINPRCEEITLGGVKFDDQNGNGTREAGEPGLPHWIIELKVGPYQPQFDYNNNGSNDSNDYGVLEDVIVDHAECPAGKMCDFNNDGSIELASGDLPDFQNWLGSRDRGNEVTDAQGHYQFGGLSFGDYIVTEVQEAGWTPTTDPRVSLTLETCDTTVDFGNHQETPNGSISGHKWHDLNHDGVWQQPDEPPIMGWAMTLSGDGAGAAVTDAAGAYAFSNLPAGAYTVTEETRSVWTHSTAVSIAVTLAQGENRTGVDFGNYQTGVCENAITLDFDRDASGVDILRGQFIDSEYLPWGIAVTAHNYNAAHPQAAITFDSDTPTGGINGDQIVDVDLGTPNLQFGGPGNSETGDGREPSNSVALHNLLIIPDNVVDTTPADGLVDDPNDEPAGGSLRFTFSNPMAFSSVKYIDLDHNGGEVVGYSDATGTAQVFSIPVPVKNGNSVQQINGDQATPIRMLKLRGSDSYGVDEVVLCPPAPSCSDGAVNQPSERCDDGNLVNGDGCEDTCTPTTWCGDGAIQTPNSYGQSEQCDDGERNGSEQSSCTSQCTPKLNQCDAKSPGYYKNNDGCQNGTGSSTWSDEVNVLSDSFFDVFSTITGPQVCTQLADNCNSGSDVDKARCKAKWHLLADEANTVASRQRLDALIAGSYDGNAAFAALGLTPTSTVQQAYAAVEQVIANGGSTKDELNRAAYVAARVYTFYEEENPVRPECILPGLGNGIVEPGEQCDDGNLVPWDGCSVAGQQEVVLNEILPNPLGADNAPKPGGEWVELYNRSAKPISLEGWMLYDVDDSHELFITAEKTTVATTTVAAGGHLVIYRDGDSDFNLNNSGDSVRLFNDEIGDGGSLIDSFSWSSAKGEGNSYARVPDGNGDWVDPCPTPGADNIADSCEMVGFNAPLYPLIMVDEEPADVLEPVLDAALFSEDTWLELFPVIEYAAVPEPTPTPSPSPTPSEPPLPQDSPAADPATDTDTGTQDVAGETSLVSDAASDVLKAEETVTEPEPVDVPQPTDGPDPSPDGATPADPPASS